MKTADSFTLMRIKQQEIVAAQGIFAAKEFRAAVSVNWIGTDGEHYSKDFLFTENDTEFIQFMNDWGARKSAEVMQIQDYNRMQG